MRIVFLCEQYPPVLWDGAGIYTHTVSQALARRGHEVHVVCAQGYRFRDEVDNGVQVHRRPLLRAPISRLLGRYSHLITSRDHPRDSLTFRASLAVSYAVWLRQLDLHPDVVETADGETRALLSVVPRRHPVVIHLHTPSMFDVRLRGPISLKGRIADRIDRFSSDRADVVTSPSALIADRLRDFGWLQGRDVEVIPNPFDSTRLSQVEPAGATRNVVLTVGRLEWGKGIDVLFDAVARLAADGTDVEVVLAGRPAGEIHGEPAGPWLEHRAKELGINCTFAGHVTQDELFKLYAQARVVAVPSRFESFSTAAVEAMAAARPVVTTHTTGIAPFVTRWNAGTVVDPDDPPALADALALYLGDATRAVTTGAAGRLGVVDLHPDAIAQQREQAYHQAIDHFDTTPRRRRRTWTRRTGTRTPRRLPESD